MTSAPLSLSSHDRYLTPEETDALILIAQAVPAYDYTDPDGMERTSWGVTRDSDRALSDLTQAYLPLMHKLARNSTALDFDDALMVCLEEFVSVVRRYEVGSVLPFVAGLGTILARKLGDVGRTSGLIVVRENAAARYRQLMDRVDWDLDEAYRQCVETNNGFTPDTFLAVHRALGVGSLDVTVREQDRTSRVSGSSPSGYSTHEGALGDTDLGPEDLTVQAETVRHLFTCVTPRQEQILRLRYGFADLATENARLAAGFRADSADLVMSDREVAQVVGSTTPTVNRERGKALGVMRLVLEEAERA